MKKKLLSVLVSAIIFAGGFLSEAASAAVTTYKVAAGDTLWKISRSFNVSVEDLKKWNNLSSDIISIGQTLKVAPIHVVVSGETLWIISRKYGITVDNLMKLNNLTSSAIYVGQVLNIAEITAKTPSVQTVNYKVVSGDNLWTLAKKYSTSVEAIIKTNMLVTDYVMPGQILTIPVNSTSIVKPVGITMMKARVNNSFGDIYTWENAMRLWTVGTTGTLKDLATGKTFNIRYYGGSNHSDIVTLTQEDTNIMQSIYGTWSWTKKRPMVLSFTKGGTSYQMAVSLTGMPHSSTDSITNGMAGHCDLYFYNSVGHSDPVVDPVHQANILKANGQ
ncbi:LysM peptidoglycan-binding domain-containing protein [Clostridium sp. SYSU_GA19001]|uniref:LysM peptidoglycan-binding domain-containing protein n=1 Tax=Clostridium caldaquaticum TaxID=2940653 RepID=UPI00207726C4|nr:LysM peptidoglycan-binding domain-containing protein [Clostridium caldaquaticum]MCM8710227.1 LysM peptidoglycan-binding domain-containing protein [Clostridium caldaquaticum]